jgi:hypothetical protein
MKRWLWPAVMGLGVCLLLALVHPEVGRGGDRRRWIAGWGRSVGRWGKPALALLPAAPAKNREPRLAPPPGFESFTVELLRLTEGEVAPWGLDPRGPPGRAEAPWVEGGAAGQTGSPNKGGVHPPHPELCRRIRHYVPKRGFCNSL